MASRAETPPPAEPPTAQRSSPDPKSLPPQPLAAERFTPTELAFEPVVSYQRAILTLRDPAGIVGRHEFAPGVPIVVSVVPAAGGSPADGVYNYILRVVPRPRGKPATQYGRLVLDGGRVVTREELAAQRAALSPQAARDALAGAAGLGGSTGRPAARQELAAEILSPTELRLEPKVPWERAALMVQGPDLMIRQTFPATLPIAVSLVPAEADAPLDGAYSYILKLEPAPAGQTGIQRGRFRLEDGAVLTRPETSRPPPALRPE